MTTRQQWAIGFLAYAGWEVSQEKIIALVAQAAKEGSTAVFNPLDTEEDAPGATDYNAAGVKSYTSLDAGYGATLATFKNKYYPGLVGILSDPDGGSAVSYATNVELNTWGTGNCLAEVESIKAGDPHGYLEVVIAGSSSEPPGTSVPSGVSPPAPRKDEPVSIAVAPDGTKVIERVSPEGHQLVFTLAPGQTAWQVTDVTDQIKTAFPADPPFTVQP